MGLQDWDAELLLKVAHEIEARTAGSASPFTVRDWLALKDTQGMTAAHIAAKVLLLENSKRIL